VFSEEGGGNLVDQEILIASGAERTVLVVRVGYSDAGKGDFAFLLPIQKAPVAVYDGDPNLFQGLGAKTVPRVTILQESGAGSGQSGCCGALGGMKTAGAGAPGGANEVEVIERGETNTYEYAVVGGKDAGTLAEWLEKEKFVPLEGTQAALDEYVRGKWLFLAAKLKPKGPRGSLAPIEIQLPAIPVEELRYPLGLSAQSVPPTKQLEVLLYLMTIGSALPANYGVARIKSTELRALSATESDYKEISNKKLATGDFLIEYGAGEVKTDEVFNWEKPPASTPEGDKPPPLAESYEKLFPQPFSLVRLHARLGATALKDMQFKTVGAEDVKQSNVFVVYHSSKVGASAGALLLMLTLFRRKGRRGAHSMPKRALFSAKN
jgi:hypothetical protein